MVPPLDTSLGWGHGNVPRLGEREGKVTGGTWALRGEEPKANINCLSLALHAHERQKHMHSKGRD